MAPDILRTGKPVCFGGTDPALTKMGNPWLIRFRPNDSYSGRVIAVWSVRRVGLAPTGKAPPSHGARK
jgi:branched-chain amino acid transport system substrate-binding protein